MRPWIRKVLQVRDTPEAQARGLAIGVFFGTSVLFGFHALLAIAVSSLARGNKVLAIAATAVNNPLTSLPLYGGSYAIGRAIVRGSTPMPDWSVLTSLKAMLALGPHFLLRLVVGTTVVGVVASLVTYLLSSRLLGLLSRFSTTASEQATES